MTTGATAVSDCVACTTGNFCPPGTGIARACPPGSSCAGLQLDRYDGLCTAGQYFNGGCTNCDANHYCPPGVVYPLKCPAGTKGTGSTGGADRFVDCVPCATGEICPRYGQSGPGGYTATAGSGYYAARGTEFKHQLACPPGFYSNNASPTGWTGCTKCPAGQACPLGTGTRSGGLTPLKCEPGYYCKQETDQGTLHTRQYPCSGGYYGTSDSLYAASGTGGCS